jgi:hypothetical protein
MKNRRSNRDDGRIRPRIKLQEKPEEDGCSEGDNRCARKALIDPGTETSRSSCVLQRNLGWKWRSELPPVLLGYKNQRFDLVEESTPSKTKEKESAQRGGAGSIEALAAPLARDERT